MTDQEIRKELIAARSAGIAAMICFQQLVRVILEHGIMTPAQIQDAASEALAMLVTGPASNAFEKSVNEEAAQLLVHALGEERP